MMTHDNLQFSEFFYLIILFLFAKLPWQGDSYLFKLWDKQPLKNEIKGRCYLALPVIIKLQN